MRLLSYIALLFLSLVAKGQNIYVEVSKEEVVVYESFTYTIIAHKKCEIVPPDFEGFEIIGQISGQSYQSSGSYGQVQSTQIYSEEYTLRPVAAGIYTIGSAQLKCGKKGGVEKSEEVKITVTTDEQGLSNKEGSAEYYVTLETNKSTVMMGEAFVLTLKYYSKARPVSVGLPTPGSSDGLWRQDLRKADDPYSISRLPIKGTQYYVLELNRELCIPLRSGKIKIEPTFAKVYFQQDIFNQYSQDGYSNGLEINVLALPEQRPDDFNGLVGSFELEDNIDFSKVNEGEAIELNISISGCGNLNAFDPPQLELPPSFKHLDPVVTEEIEYTGRGVEGTVEYTFSFTPTEEGRYTIDPYHFSYYDLPSKSIKSHTTNEFVIDVEPKGAGGDIKKPENPDPASSSQKDISYISESSEGLFQEQDIFFGSLMYTIGISTPIVFAVFFVVFRLRRENRSEDEKELERKKLAKKSALKGLEQASTLLAGGNERETLRAIQSMLDHYFMAKLGMSRSEISQKNISTKLQQNNASAETIALFNQIWSKAEMAQFAPVSPENLSQMIADTGKLINQINIELT